MNISDFKAIEEIEFPQAVNQIFETINQDTVRILPEQGQLLVQTDMDGIIQYANDAFKDHFGRGANTTINKSIYAFDHPALPKSVQRLMAEQVSRDDDTNAVLINSGLDGEIMVSYAEIDVVKDRHGEHIHIFTRKRHIDRDNIFRAVVPFYKLLIKKELEEGVDAAYDYLGEFITKNGFKDFNTLMDFLAFAKDK